MKFAPIAAIAALAIAGIPSVAAAQEAPAAAQAQVAVGATVYGPEGNEVGVIESMGDGVATLNTGTNVATLPMAAFGPGENGPSITVTKAQVDQMVEQAAAEAAAKLDAALVVGAPVLGAQGNALGNVTALEEESVEIEGEHGKFMLPRNLFLLADAGVVARVLASDIEAQLVGGAE